MAPTIREVGSPPERRPVMLYDADCRFCVKWIARWKALSGERIDYCSYQECLSDYPEIPVEQCREAVQLIETDGRVYTAAEAVFRALKEVAPWRQLYWLYQHSPGFAATSEKLYHFVATHRYSFSVLTRLLWGRSVAPPTYRVSSWLFLRLLGLIFFIAFASFWAQSSGLVGSNGIYPFQTYLDQLGQAYQGDRFYQAPSLFWLNAGDAFLQQVLIAGMVVSLLLICGIFPPLLLLLLWASYLSLTTAVPVFLSFQWDSLLIETGFMAFWMAPWVLRERWSKLISPSRIGRFLLWWLLFRLMFESGVVKLNSFGPEGENTWLNLTALDYHYWTQPLPTWIGWYLAKCPHWFHAISVIVMFLIEVALPFFIWGPRRLRNIAFVGLVGFQLLIILSGNYGFFNLLAIVLCVTLIDDQSLPRFLQRRLASPSFSWQFQKRSRLGWIRLPVLLFVLFVSSAQLLTALNWVERRPRPNNKPVLPKEVQLLLSRVRSFRSINSYGLFRVMTTERPEIIIQGRHEGGDWQTYDFKWKPDDLSEPPRFVIPHMPRLDWQMWFAALRPNFRHTQQQWFANFIRALLENRSEVTALLKRNPFPDSPPDAIRALKYHYRFTSFQERRKTGNWWKRERVAEYMPVVKARR